MRRLLGDEALRERVVAGGIETVELDLNVSRYVDQLEALLVASAASAELETQVAA